MKPDSQIVKKQERASNYEMENPEKENTGKVLDA